MLKDKNMKVASEILYNFLKNILSLCALKNK